MKADQELVTSFGYWVRRRRKALDLTQAALAQAVGCALVTLKKIEWDERRPSSQMAERLAECLEISPAEKDRFLRLARGEFVTVTLSPSVELETRFFKHNLPSPTTLFVGREQELADITHRLQEPAYRLLTLVGPGGIGKTRLALAAAAQTIETFPQEITFVSLASIGEVEFIAPAIAEALRFPFYGQTDPKDQLLDYLREKTLLLIVDNFEHLLEGADLLSEILSQAPDITLLVTSRERLHLQEEWVYEVQGLAFPASDGQTAEAYETSAVLETYSAVELFTQRARQMEASFTPSASEMADIGRICRLVEGMPLGLELAAPWIRTLSCREIVAEIERNLDFLTTTLRNVPERHRSLRAVFEQTWGRLPAAEQVTLQQLSVFRGGCTREAAEAITGVTLPLLAALVDKALLRRTTSGRYELHEMVRQFASAKLDEAQQIAAVRNRHLRYYMALAEEVEPQLRFGQQVAQRYTQLEAEHDNLRAALNWALSGGEFVPGLRLVGALCDFWAARGYLPEGQAQAERFLARPEAAVQTVERARALLTAGVLAANQHNYPTAQPLLSESEAIARTLGSGGRFILARACIELGWTSLAFLDFAAAQRYGQKSLVLGQALDEPWLQGHALILLGAIACDRGDYPAARQYYEAAVECCQPLGCTGVYGGALSGLGLFLYSQGDYQAAHTHLTQSIAIFNTLGDRLAMAWSLAGLGDIAAAQNKLAEAEQFYNQALAIQRELRDYDHASCTLEAMGRLAQQQGDYERARTLLQESLVLRLEMGYRPAIASTLEAMGALAAGQGQAERAARLFGAVEASLRQDNAFINPVLQPWYESLVSTLRDQLGETAFIAAWAAGAALELDEVIALVLEKDHDFP